MHIACIQDRSDVVKLLLTICTDKTLYLQSRFGSTPLIIACRKSKPVIIELLLEHTKNIQKMLTIQDNHLNTPIHYICAHNKHAIINFILKKYNILPLFTNLKNKTNHTAFDLITDIDIIKLIKCKSIENYERNDTLLIKG